MEGGRPPPIAGGKEEWGLFFRGGGLLGAKDAGGSSRPLLGSWKFSIRTWRYLIADFHTQTEIFGVVSASFPKPIPH